MPSIQTRSIPFFRARLWLLFGALSLGCLTNPALAQSRLDYVFGSGDSFANGVATEVFAQQLQDDGSFLIEIGSIDAGTGRRNERLFKSTVDGFGLVVDHNQTLPGVPDVNIHELQVINMNARGDVSYLAQGGGGQRDKGIFFWDQSDTREVAYRGHAAPDMGGGTNGVFETFNQFINHQLSDDGQIAFRATLVETAGGFLVDDRAVFQTDASGVLKQVVRDHQTLFDSAGTRLGKLDGFYDFAQSGNGEIVFLGLVYDVDDPKEFGGMFRVNGDGTYETWVEPEQTVPDGTRTFEQLSRVVLNRNGQAAFHADTTGFRESGIYMADGTGVVEIAQTGGLTPEGNRFSGFGINGAPANKIALNDDGQVAFLGSFDDSSGDSSAGRGIFRSDGIATDLIARTGIDAPGGNGVVSSFADHSRSIGEGGQMGLYAGMDGTANGRDDDFGFFVGDGIDLLKVVQEGDALGDSAVDIFSSTPMNRYGQAIVNAILENGDSQIYQWTPELNWRSTTAGNWRDANNWTLTYNPVAGIHDTFIADGSQITSEGDLFFGDTDDRSLAGGKSLTQTGGRLQVNGDLHVGAAGQVKLAADARLLVGGDRSTDRDTTFVIGGTSAARSFKVTGGGVFNNDGAAVLGEQSGFAGDAEVRGLGSTWNNASLLSVGRSGTGTMLVDGGGTVSSSGGLVGFNADGQGTVRISGEGSKWNTSFVDVGNSGVGSLDILNGGSLSGAGMSIGRFNNGRVTIDGPESRWNVKGTGTLRVGWGTGGNGLLEVINGGQINGGPLTAVGSAQDSVGRVHVVGSESRWNSERRLSLGNRGFGGLRIEAGGVVEIESASLAQTFSTGRAEVFVSGSGSRWELARSLLIGGAGQGDVTIASGGLVKAGSADSIWRTTIAENSSVTLGGGRFDFGTSDRASLGRIAGSGGSLAGAIEFNETAFQISALDQYIPLNLNVNDVSIANEGSLQGSGSTEFGVRNLSSGTIAVAANQQARISGTRNLNRGVITNSGQLIFDHEMINESSGQMSSVGGGQWGFGGGLTNAGQLNFEGGETLIVGAVSNLAGGSISTAQGGKTYFRSDVSHNGDDIFTETGSLTVFEGILSGSGVLTGQGNVLVEGGLQPGNSPGLLEFNGNLTLGSDSETLIEIAGLESGLFDRFEVGGFLDLDGTLQVELIDGFELGRSEEFWIADTANLNGTFDGLSNGGLVGNYGGQDLFIRYSRADRQGFVLFTAVPEPGSGIILGLAGLLLVTPRRRRAMACIG